jgi:hypothetical protein
MSKPHRVVEPVGAAPNNFQQVQQNQQFKLTKQLAEFKMLRTSLAK